MRHEPTTLAPFYQGWERYQQLLTETIGPLTSEQLALRAAPALRPVWVLGAHILDARLFWFREVLREGNSDLDTLLTWFQPDTPPARASELVHGLEASWRMIQNCLDRWTPAMLDDSFEHHRDDEIERFTRQWVLWHVLEHDLHHGGELFLTLGMHGLPTPEL